MFNYLVMPFLLLSGDMLTFDNLRILHGRGAFTSSRCLIGAYLDTDIVNSRIRVLLSKIESDKIEK